MTAKSDELVDELVSACIAFGRGVAPDWQTRIEKVRRELRAYVADVGALNIDADLTIAGLRKELSDIHKMFEIPKRYSDLWHEREWLRSKLTFAEKVIAKLEAAQRWIPVSERLPEPNQSVLVFDRLGDMTIDFLVTFNREGVAYYTNSDDGAVCWMPLPTPPEVQE